MRHSEEQEEGVGTEQRSRKASRSSRLRRTEIKKMKDTVEWSMKSSWEVLCGAAGGHKSGRSLESRYFKITQVASVSINHLLLIIYSVN